MAGARTDARATFVNGASVFLVIPAKAGIQFSYSCRYVEKIKMDPDFRRDDSEVIQTCRIYIGPLKPNG
jgi:hypothetical protein